MIYVLGRKNVSKGHLINLTAGGESKSGWVCPEEYREKWSGKNNPMYGAFGEKNPNSRLTDLQRQEIKEQYVPRVKGVNYGNLSRLAQRYGVHYTTILRIVKSEEA